MEEPTTQRQMRIIFSLKGYTHLDLFYIFHIFDSRNLQPMIGASTASSPIDQKLIKSPSGEHFFSGMHNYVNIWWRVSVSQFKIGQITDVGGISLPVWSFMLMS